MLSDRRKMIEEAKKAMATKDMSYNSIIEKLKAFDTSNMKDNIDNTPETSVIEKSITYVWVLANTIDELDVERGEKIKIVLNNADELETVFSYHAVEGYINTVDEDTGDTLRVYSDKSDLKALYLGVDETVLNAPGNEEIKAMFRQSKFYYPTMYRVSEFKLVRENGDECALSSIKF